MILALAAFFAAVAALGLWVGRLAGEDAGPPTIQAAATPPAPAPAPPAVAQPTAPQRAFAAVVPYRSAAPPGSIGAFRLMDHERKVVTEADLRGHYSLVFFGYTNCLQICGPTLANLSLAMDELGTAAESINVYFITVDPKRDTRTVMEAYVRGTNERIRGVTGTDEQVEAALAAFGAERIMHPAATTEANDTLIEHAAVVFFLDREGRYKTHFREGMPAFEMAMAIRNGW